MTYLSSLKKRNEVFKVILINFVLYLLPNYYIEVYGL